MAIKIGKKLQITFLAAFVLNLDNGRTETQHSPMTLKVFGVSEWKDKVKNALIQDVMADSLLKMDVQGENGEDLPFTDEVKKAVLEDPDLLAQLWEYQKGIQNGISTDQVKKVLLGN